MSKRIREPLVLSSDPDMSSKANAKNKSDKMDSSGNVYKAQTVSGLSPKKQKRNAIVLQPGDKNVIKDELTTGQTGILYGLPQSPIVMVTDPTVTTLFKRYYTTYEEYRTLRKDPTISLCRAVIVGPILSSNWTVQAEEGVDEEIVKFIKGQMLKRRFRLMESALYGCIDFGWQGFEKIFEAGEYNVGDEKKPKMEKLIGLRKIKPLLQDMTSIMVYLYNGDFAGFRQGVTFVESPAKAMLVNYRVEGTMWHGCPLLEDAKASVEKWETCDEGACRYDKKIAGSHFVVHYPLGSSRLNGVDTDNGVIARGIIRALEASGSISVPSTLLNFIEGMESAGEPNLAWKVEFLETRAARQSNFVDRLRYLDSCKARAMHVPERAIMEGQFGTKAEAEGHQDTLTVLLENMDYHITDLINRQCVDQLIELNYGKDFIGRVWLESPPISDDKIQYVRNVLDATLANPSGFMELYPHLDTEAMLDQCEVPRNKDVKPNKQGMLAGAMAGMPGAMPGQGMVAGNPLSPQQAGFAKGMGMQPGQQQPVAGLLKALGGRQTLPNGNGASKPGFPAGNGQTAPQTPGQPAAGGPVPPTKPLVGKGQGENGKQPPPAKPNAPQAPGAGGKKLSGIVGNQTKKPKGPKKPAPV